jgi:hypothetical protein
MMLPACLLLQAAVLCNCIVIGQDACSAACGVPGVWHVTTAVFW